jgi:hypothetical protein
MEACTVSNWRAATNGRTNEGADEAMDEKKKHKNGVVEHFEVGMKILFGMNGAGVMFHPSDLLNDFLYKKTLLGAKMLMDDDNIMVFANDVGEYATIIFMSKSHKNMMVGFFTSKSNDPEDLPEKAIFSDLRDCLEVIEEYDMGCTAPVPDGLWEDLEALGPLTEDETPKIFH